MEIKLHLKRIGATGFHILANGQTVATFKRRSYKRACITLNQMENLLLAAGHPEPPSSLGMTFSIRPIPAWRSPTWKVTAATALEQVGSTERKNHGLTPSNRNA
jgi:hypothetical protein